MEGKSAGEKGCNKLLSPCENTCENIFGRVWIVKEGKRFRLRIPYKLVAARGILH